MNGKMPGPSPLPPSLMIQIARQWKVSEVLKSENGYTAFFAALKQGVVYQTSRLFKNSDDAYDYLKIHEKDFIKQAAGLSQLTTPRQ